MSQHLPDAENTIVGNIQGFFADSGFYQILLPFLFIFVVFFAILRQIDLFSSDNTDGQKMDTVIALILSLLITQTTSFMSQLSSFMATQGGLITVIIMGFLFFLILSRFVTGENARERMMDGKWRVIIVFTILAILSFVFFNEGGGTGLIEETLGIDIEIPGITVDADVGTPEVGGIHWDGIITVLVIVALIWLVLWSVDLVSGPSSLFKKGTKPSESEKPPE